MATPVSFELDGRVRRLGRAGEVLLGGEPFKLIRLSPEGARALDALTSALPGALSDAAAELAKRLVASGVLHPVPSARAAHMSEVAVVVPVRDEAGRLGRLLYALRRDFTGDILVVDDGSTAAHGGADRIAEVTLRLGGTLHRRPTAGGPATARNVARSALAGAEPASLIAFVDSDVTPELGWLDGLVGHFADGAVGAVAPRVSTSRGVGAVGRALAAYESIRSPLDLGTAPGIVGAHHRVSYVPSAAIVCRRTALDDVGWFDPAMRVGEDVDLVRRLEAAGWTVRYEPRVRVWHDARGGFLGFVRQRYGYGTSAADLEGRHPGTIAPFEGTLWGVGAVAGGAAVAGAALVALVPAARGTLCRMWDICVPHGPESRRAAAAMRGRRTLGATWDTCIPYDAVSRRVAPPRRSVAVVDTGAALAWLAATWIPVRAFRAQLAQVGVPTPARIALGTVTKGQLLGAGGLATAVRRVWWPPALVAAILAPSLRRPMLGILAASEVVGVLPVWHRGRRPPGAGIAPPGAGIAPPGLVTTLVLATLDDFAYGAGVWAGCVRHGSLRAVAPRVVRPAPARPPSDPQTPAD